MQIKLRGQKLKCAASIVTTWGGKELGFWKEQMSMIASPQVKQQAPILWLQTIMVVLWEEVKMNFNGLIWFITTNVALTGLGGSERHYSNSYQLKYSF